MLLGENTQLARCNPLEPVADATVKSGPLLEIRYYPQDGSVFLNMQYLIRGVAGAILWKLVREHVLHSRNEFSLRELRLAGAELRLPELQDNLSARLILLRRRLAEHGAPIHIHQSGRGRFCLAVERPLTLASDSWKGDGGTDRATPGSADGERAGVPQSVAFLGSAWPRGAPA